MTSTTPAPVRSADRRYRTLAIDDPTDLLFGVAPRPLTTRRGLILGGGTVYPELNFTLPTMFVQSDTLDEVYANYRQIIDDALRRAVELDAPGLVVEFETVPPMTEHPDWGLRIVQILLDGLHEAHAKHGLRSVLRVTPNDNREMVRPPRMRSGFYWDGMVELFERSAEAGAELLSIESVGGKELHDEALTMCDLHQVIFSLCVLGVRDMRFLWTEIDRIARRHDVHAAGDTACGFGNTAMVLAHQRIIPRTFAAVVRAITAVRSLAAYECGAVGPGKDCGYENPILKAITGLPMAMEGKSAACAHSSPMGNLAAACCDVWSNESVQNVRLLGGMAPTVSLEQLVYDCRLMNVAAADGRDAQRQYRDWLVRSDAALDPQALMISPDSAIRLARVIVAADSDYHAGRAVAFEAVRILREAHETGNLRIPAQERGWLDRMQADLETLPDEEDRFIEQRIATVDAGTCLLGEYDLQP